MRLVWLPLFALTACFYVTQQERKDRLDLDGDGVPWPVDCDDDDAKVGELLWYVDADEDGFGDPNTEVSACEQPEGHVAEGTDCDDDSDQVFPGAVERCNGIDDDCDSEADNGAEVPTWYLDGDGDGQGDPNQALQACDQPSGAVANSDDCDDTDERVKRGGTEIACNDIDDDCDGDVDLDDSDVDPTPWTWFYDGDGDQYGCTGTFVCDAAEVCQGAPIVACDAPTGYAAAAGDCADDDDQIGPGALETCNGWDDDCDCVTDPYGSDGSTPFYQDGDGDGYGGAVQVDACTQPVGYVPAGPADCDDGDPCSFPGAIEYCNGDDNDCDLDIDDANSGTCTVPPGPGECPNP